MMPTPPPWKEKVNKRTPGGGPSRKTNAAREGGVVNNKRS